MIPGLDEVRLLAFTNIDAAVSVCAKNTLDYLKNTEKNINPLTEQTYLFYQKEEDGR